MTHAIGKGKVKLVQQLSVFVGETKAKIRNTKVSVGLLGCLLYCTLSKKKS